MKDNAWNLQENDTLYFFTILYNFTEKNITLVCASYRFSAVVVILKDKYPKNKIDTSLNTLTT